ncbi:hypothetical protein GCM10020227_54740 [Streptomyces flavovirens]
MRVVLAERPLLLRQGIIQLLEAYDCEVVAAVDNGTDLGTPSANTAPTSPWWTSAYPRRSPPRASRAAPARPARGSPVCRSSSCPSTSSQMYARELLADGTGGIGYLLKDSVLDDGQFIDAVRRGRGRRHRMDPAVVPS